MANRASKGKITKFQYQIRLRLDTQIWNCGLDVSLSLGCLEVLNLEQQPREARRRAHRLSWLEHLPYKERVGGSSPSAPTKFIQTKQKQRRSINMGTCGCGFTTDPEKNCNGTHRVVQAVKADMAEKLTAAGFSEASDFVKNDKKA